MNQIITLDLLKPEQSGYIKQLCSNNPMKRRLMDLGFLPGTKITCLFQSPAKDPLAYRICGTTIVLRKEDSKSITVTLS
jgi:ferrous iron transport protein A